MENFTVHDLLKHAILGELEGYTTKPEDKVPVFFILEGVAMNLADLAFSYDQFMDSASCLADNEVLSIVLEDGEPLSLVLKQTSKNYDKTVN